MTQKHFTLNAVRALPDGHLPDVDGHLWRNHEHELSLLSGLHRLAWHDEDAASFT